MNQISTDPSPSTEELKLELQKLEAKYETLVWYARKPPTSDADYWEPLPQYIREGAFKALMKAEEDYPDDISELRYCDSNWQHGFNSGMLAALRFVMTAQFPCLMDADCSDDGQAHWYGGISDAHDEFPMLDT